MSLEGRQPLQASFHAIGVVHEARVDCAVPESQILEWRKIGIVTSIRTSILAFREFHGSFLFTERPAQPWRIVLLKPKS